MKYTVRKIKKYSDILTPVSLYLRLRDRFSETLLLESSDYNSNKNSFTFIVADVLETFELTHNNLSINDEVKSITKEVCVKKELNKFISNLDVNHLDKPEQFNGLYGFTSFEAVKFFDTFNFEPKERKDNIPLMKYSFYRFVIAINHFNDKIILLENILENDHSKLD